MEITARVWEGTDYLPHVFDRWLAEPGASFEVAELDGLVVGFQRLRPITREIVFYEGLRVAEEYRRRGIARSMLRHAIEEVAAQGFRELRVITGNPAACRLLDSEGFRRLAHSSVWLAGRVEGPDLPRMVSADEAAALLGTMLRNDPALAAYGGVNGHWQEVLDLDEALLRRLAGEGLVRSSSGGRALAVIEPGTHNRLAISFVAGSGVALQDLLMGLRFEADSQGYQGVRLYAPRAHPAADDFTEVGYHLADGQVERYSYARDLRVL